MSRDYEVKAELFRKDKEEYTRFRIGKKVSKTSPLLIKLIIALGGKKVKESKYFDYYEVKGDQIKLGYLI